jgi:hypothetical protein
LDGLKSPISNLQSPLLFLGLGQVRELRRESARGIVGKRPFSSLADLLERVALQPKEVNHLIRCGALDGLGESRAALLAEADEILRAGSARQMAFAFARQTAVPPESPADRLAWELELLGLPISVHPAELVQPPSNHCPIRHLPQSRGQLVTLVGTRLPGWTGGKGFFFDDGDDYVIVQGMEKGGAPLWEGVAVNGRYRQDEWGGGWFQAAERGR